jgi:HPt (histidine-containing phosphotransfer) domain-containing protein
LQELGGLSEEIYDSLCKEHLEQTLTRCAQIEEAIAAERITEAGEIAHSIKGASGNLRLHTLYESALELERAAKDGASQETVRAKFQQLEACLKSFIPAG